MQTRTITIADDGTQTINIDVDGCGRVSAVVLDHYTTRLDGQRVTFYKVRTADPAYADHHRDNGALWITHFDIVD